MKSKNNEQTQRVLLLLKIDANNLFHRIKTRKNEYLEIFALRRTRDHFPMIFNNRYLTTSLEDLSHCSTELISALDEFYRPVEEMSWFLFQTQDMPNTVEDFIDRKIRRLQKLIDTLNMYLDAELGFEVKTEEILEEPKFLSSDFSDESEADKTIES